MSSEVINNFVAEAGEGLADLVESVELLNQYVVIMVQLENLVEVAEKLRDNYGYVIPVAAGGVDYLEEEKIQMIYYLCNPETRFTVMLKVDLPRGNPRAPSLTRVWEAMSFHEREACEMFGVHFEGHPNLVPLLLPPSWKGGYPLRKDFKGEGVEQ